MRDDLVPWLEETEARFAEHLRAAVTEGSIRDIDADAYARLLVATATGGAFLFMTSPNTASDPAAPLRTIIDSLAATVVGQAAVRVEVRAGHPGGIVRTTG